jgi:hypothetical protein
MPSYGTSTSTHSIGNGSKTFIVDTGLPMVAGEYLRFAPAETPGTYLAGTVTDYTNDLLTVAVVEYAGTGSFSEWNIVSTGVRGATGPQGAPGGYSELDFAQALNDFDIPAGTGFTDLPGLTISFTMPSRPVMLKMGMIVRYVGPGDGILELVETTTGNVIVEVHSGSSEQSGDWKQLYTERRLTAGVGTVRSFKVRAVRRPLTYRVAGAFEYPQWIGAYSV